MTGGVFVVDTNVVVSGAMSVDPGSPTARILDAMLDGRIIHLMSGSLLAEYSQVLRRPGIARLHRLADDDIDRLLTVLAANAMWCQPTVTAPAPDSGDDHLWALLASRPGARLVTGDRHLLENPLRPGAALTPREAVLAVRSA